MNDVIYDVINSLKYEILIEKGNIFVVVIDFNKLYFTYNICIIAELQREVTSIPLLTGLFTLRDRVSAKEDESL